MEWEIEFIKALQSGAVFDYILYFFTQFGSEIVFMAAVMLIYWCIDKREGFRLVNLFMVAQLIVGVIKVSVKRKRPYYYDGIEPILQKTDGYSFPSGHSNNIAVIGTDISIMTKRKYRSAFKYVLGGSIAMIFLVMFSRMYLGQHFLTDVITGCAIGVVVAIVGTKVFDMFGDKEERAAFVIVPLCLILFVFTVVAFAVWGKDFDSVMTVAGTYSAAAIGYFLEKRFVNYDIKADKFYKYFIRILIGAAVALLIKEGLKPLFNLFASGVWSLILTQFVRYFLIGIWVTLLAPMLFKKLKI